MIKDRVVLLKKTYVYKGDIMEEEYKETYVDADTKLNVIVKRLTMSGMASYYVGYVEVPNSEDYVEEDEPVSELDLAFYATDVTYCGNMGDDENIWVGFDTLNAKSYPDTLEEVKEVIALLAKEVLERSKK